MDPREKMLKAFLEKLLVLSRELDAMEHYSWDLSEIYNSKAFPEQEHLSADILAGLVMAATHETASALGFYANDIENLAHFIGFREKYKEFSDSELLELLDGNASPGFKKNLSPRFENIKDMLARIEELRGEWNRTFANRSYSQIKKQLRLPG